VRRLALLAAFLVALAMMQVGCAGGSSHENASLSQATNLALKTGTFTVVVTGTSRSVQRSTTVTFVVK
jgi:hypothetical protein